MANRSIRGWACGCAGQPVRVCGPATVLRRHRGNCFELSSVLASLLIGAGYDAYQVSGYAELATTHADTSHDRCPLLATAHAAPASAPPPACHKYRPRAARTLRSRYEAMMAEREETERERRRADQMTEELAERVASPPICSPPSTLSESGSMIITRVVLVFVFYFCFVSIVYSSLDVFYTINFVFFLYTLFRVACAFVICLLKYLHVLTS